MEAAIFVVCAAVVLVGALGVVISRNPVHSALSLVATLFGVAVLFLNQNAQLLAAVQVIVYTGAIVVLILFVLMLLGVDREEDVTDEPIVGQRILAALAGLALLGSVLVVFIQGGEQVATGQRSATAALSTQLSNIAQLGRTIFTTWIFAFEITAGLLTIAVVGAVVMSRRPGLLRAHPRARVHGRRQRGGAGMTLASLSLNPLSPVWYLVLGAFLFTIGAVGLLVRRNPLVMLMCVELMLNAVNLTFVTFGTMLDDIGGQVIVFFVLVVAAAEVVVGLAIIVAVSRRRPGADADDISLLRG